MQVGMLVGQSSQEWLQVTEETMELQYIVVKQ
jgi:hypothetical protein